MKVTKTNIQLRIKTEDKYTYCEWVDGCPKDTNGKNIKCFDECPASRLKMGDKEHFKVRTYKEAKTWWKKQ